jgi:serine protease inhibitor
MRSLNRHAFPLQERWLAAFSGQLARNSPMREVRMKSLLSLLFPLFIVTGALPAAPPTAPATDQTEAVQGSNAFAVDLYGQLGNQPGNLFFSPESISTAFAMAYAGAHGQTATEMARVFHFTLPPDRLHPAMGALLAGMNAPHQGYALSVADALWAQQGETFLPAFTKLMQTDYNAGFHALDFQSSPDAARATINQWVENQTSNKIQDLLGPGAVTPSTRLILTNAIYFKGTWSASFDKSETGDEDFHLGATQTVKTPLMHRTGSYRYYDGGAFQALELPYTGSQLSMVVLPAFPRSRNPSPPHRSRRGSINFSSRIGSSSPFPVSR